MENPIIQIDDIHLSYISNIQNKTSVSNSVNTYALSGVSLSINKGEVIGLIGKNGSGKSTLLRIVAGIICPTRGKVSIQNGNKISLLSPGVGFMPYLTGRENSILSSMLLGVRKSDAMAMLSNICEFSGLKDQFDSKLLSYSSGMRARLAFSTAVHAISDVILIDETLSVGDEEFRKKSSIAIKNLIQQGCTFLVVSHNLQWIKKHCTRTVVLKNGKISYDGATEYAVKNYLNCM